MKVYIATYEEPNESESECRIIGIFFMREQALETIVRHIQSRKEIEETDILNSIKEDITGIFYGDRDDLWSIHKKNICIENNPKANKVLKALLTEPAILTSIYDQCEYLSTHHYCHDCQKCLDDECCDDAYSQDTICNISAQSEQTILAVQKHLFPVGD